MNASTLADFLSSSPIITLFIPAMIFLAAGTICRIIACGFSIGRAFSKAVYDLTLFVFLYWCIFVFSVRYGSEVGMGIMTSQQLPWEWGSFFLNPFDIAQMMTNGTSVLTVLGAAGRMYFMALLIEFFTWLIMDLTGGTGLGKHYLKACIVVCLVGVLNAVLVYYLERLMGMDAMNDLFALLMAVSVIGTLGLGFMQMASPLPVHWTAPFI